MKAWVRNPRELESKLIVAGAQFERDYRKEDRYFRFIERNPAGQKRGKQDVRIRMDGYKALVTYKDKRIENGLEINQEYEFEVSDDRIMSDLLHRLGAEDLVEKVKIGSAWRWGDLLVEVSEILGLGHFVEIEHVQNLPDTMEKSEQEQESKKSEALIRNAFSVLQIPLADIEARSYTGMLSANRRAERELAF